MSRATTSISASARDVAPRVIHAVSPAVGPPTQRAEQAADDQALRYNWDTKQVEPVVLQPQPIQIIEAAALPPHYVHEFARRVSNVKNVKGVIAETGEDQMSVHITTFAEGLTEEIRTQIYAIESAIILAYPHVAFDFHLRRNEETSGSPTAVPGRYYYAIWGFPDADEGSTPKTGV